MNAVHSIPLVFLLATALPHGGAFAQEVAFHDLAIEKSTAPMTRTWTPSNRSCPETDDRFIEVFCGSQRLSEPENLSLSIQAVRPNILHVGDQSEVTVRLKNVGHTIASVPWQTFGPDVMQVSPDGATASHQEVGISLKLESAGRSNWIGNEIDLYANPVLGWSYVDLAPGKWVTIRLTGQVACSNEPLCKEIRPDKHAKLSASWFEYLYKRTVRDCVPSETNLTTRKINSQPFSVTLKPTYPATAER